LEEPVPNPDRVPGKRGYLPSDPERFRLTLENYVRADAAVALPPVPMSQDVDRAGKVTSWPMYCNGPDPANAQACPGSPDGCGDCTCAAIGHMIQAWTAYASSEVTVSPEAVIGLYSAVTGYDPQSGENDNGADPQSVLEYLRQTGITDSAGHTHKVAGYAAFGNPANELLLGQVLDVFGSVYVAVNLAQAQEDQFSAGQPWAYEAGSPSLGGHMICLQRRATGTDILRYVTWGELQPANKAFQAHQAVDAYAVVTEDWIAANGTTVEGMDLEQLLSDMDAVS
jgi:hypothetical protein